MSWPGADGVAVSEQVAAAVVPASVHVPPGVKVTVPVGVVAPVAEVSVTVAVQLVTWLMKTVEGVHETVVVVVCAAGCEMLRIALPVLTA